MLGLGYPEEVGGFECTLADRLKLSNLVCSAGSGGLLAGLFSHNIGLPPLLNHGGDELVQMIAPAVLKGDVFHAGLGVVGGAMQPQGHVQIVMNLVDFGMTLQEAGDAPRVQHDGSTEPVGSAKAMTDGGVVQLESGFPYETVRALMQKGHSVRFAHGPYGGYQAIMVNPEGGWVGASESRKDGQAAGY